MKVRVAARGRIAWALCAVAVGGLLFDMGVTLNAAVTVAEQMDSAWIASWLGFPIAGALITSHRSRSRIGWILVGIGLSIGLTLMSDAYLTLDGPATAEGISGYVAWVQAWAFVPCFWLIPCLVLLFPTDEFRSRTWELSAKVAASGTALLAIAYGTRSNIQLEGGREVANPFALGAFGEPMDELIPPLIATLGIFGLAAVAHAVWSFKQSFGIERQQRKWFVYAASLFPSLFLLGSLIEGIDLQLANAVGLLAFFMSFNGMAAAIGIAILRYRLYDIDVIINRTLVYGVLTAILGGAYVLIVTGAGTILRGSEVVTAGATLVVAALFQPLRRRIQGFIDRRFYRRKYDASRTAAAFSDRLRDEVDVEAMKEQLVTAVQETMQPRRVSLWLRG